jgi:hypothetical protein
MIILAPTGTAAALLGGFTYHSILGINDRMTGKQRSFRKNVTLKAEWQGQKIHTWMTAFPSSSVPKLYTKILSFNFVFSIAEILNFPV